MTSGPSCACSSLALARMAAPIEAAAPLPLRGGFGLPTLRAMVPTCSSPWKISQLSAWESFDRRRVNDAVLVSLDSDFKSLAPRAGVGRQ